MSCPFGHGNADDASLADSKEPTYYHDYLQLDKILDAQHPRSKLDDGGAAHDEHLFIVIHQVRIWPLLCMCACVYLLYCSMIFCFRIFVRICGLRRIVCGIYVQSSTLTTDSCICMRACVRILCVCVGGWVGGWVGG
jgi:Tryptophan 2,3-dioxygenase